MATINLYESYKNKLRKFGVNDSATFQQSFVEAVNLVYAELNDQVFRAETLDYIGSFDDVIDNRLFDFTTITFDVTAKGSNDAMSNRDFWTVEYDLERTLDTNTFIDTITYNTTATVIIDITNSVFSVTGAAVAGSATLPAGTSYNLKFAVTEAGNALYIDDVQVDLTYTLGDEDTTQTIGAIDSRIISSVAGFMIKRTRYLADDYVILDFLLNEGGVVTALVDEIASFKAAAVAPVWKVVWIEPSSGLSSRYRSVLDMGLDYHLQDGGQWAIEPEAERERKWYSRGLSFARNIFQQGSTYTGPLGVS